MKVLVACEESQRVTIEFRKLGHEAYSCDLLDCSGNHPGWHKEQRALVRSKTFPGIARAMAEQWGNDCSNLKKVPKNSIYGMFGGFPSISEMYNDKCFCCIADRKGNECKGKETCGNTWKRYEAIINPEWHHVSLATLANIDYDMIDEKRKLVFDINQVLKDGIRNLYKCENHISFEVMERYVIRKCDELIRQNRLKAFWFSYIARQLDEVRRNTSYLYTPYITAHRNRW